MRKPTKISASLVMERTQKSHVLADRLGNSVKLLFTDRNVHDCNVDAGVLSLVDISGRFVMGDKAYSSDRILDYITEHGVTYSIPPKDNNPDPWDCDWWQYKERHLI